MKLLIIYTPKESNLKKYSFGYINGGSLDIEVSDRKLIINQELGLLKKILK